MFRSNQRPNDCGGQSQKRRDTEAHQKRRPIQTTLPRPCRLFRFGSLLTERFAPPQALRLTASRFLGGKPLRRIGRIVLEFGNGVNLTTFWIWALPSLSRVLRIDSEVHAASETSDRDLHDKLAGLTVEECSQQVSGKILGRKMYLQSIARERDRSPIAIRRGSFQPTRPGRMSNMSLLKSRLVLQSFPQRLQTEPLWHTGCVLVDWVKF